MHSRSLFVQDFHANVFAFLKYQGQLSIEILLLISKIKCSEGKREDKKAKERTEVTLIFKVAYIYNHYNF